MESKRSKVERYVRDGEYKKALAICKNWNLPISKEESKTLSRAYECYHYGDFYRGLGYNPESEIEEAIKILKSIYL